MQVQWQHQIRASKLPHGVVVTFAEETLRVVQDAIPFHKALSSTYAEHSSAPGLSPPGCCTHLEKLSYLVTVSPSDVCMDSLAAVDYANHMAGALLGWGWWMGKLDGQKTAERVDGS